MAGLSIHLSNVVKVEAPRSPQVSEQRQPEPAGKPQDTFEPARAAPQGAPVLQPEALDRPSGKGAPETLAEVAKTWDLGEAKTGTYKFEDGTAQTYGRGMVVADPNGEAHAVRNDFYQHYIGQNAHSELGRPIDDEHFENGKVVQHFEAGTMTWTKEGGTQVSPSDPKTVPPAVTRPANNATDMYKNMYQPFQVTSKASVPAHLGAHWGPLCHYDDDAKINRVADELMKSGVGYCTVMVDVNEPHGNDKTLTALKNRGIEPVVRLYNGDKTMNEYTPEDIKKCADTAAELRREGIKMVVLDNEPNLSPRFPHDGPGYDTEMRKYTDNLAGVMKGIRAEAPDMAIGLPPMAPMKQPYEDITDADRAWEEKMYKGILHGLKDINEGLPDPALKGHVFDNTFLATHTYRPHGARVNEVYRQWARDELGSVGAGLKTLSTEGGQFCSKDKDGNWPTPEAYEKSWKSNNGDFRYLSDETKPWDKWTRDVDTTCLWIAADSYLSPESDKQWDPGAMIQPDGSRIPTLVHLQEIYAGTYVPYDGDYT